ncbi:hypothetical protein JCM10213_002187 [Rhodosporidiobolus nylandii]
MASTSSSAFEDAVAYVAASTTPTTNQTKLRLYALYCVATRQALPSAPRPGIFDWTARAKHDAWTATGREYEADSDGGKERARRDYQDEARKLGWAGAGGEEEGERAEPPAATKEEKKERMVAVSTLESGFVDDAPPSQLHELAIAGDASALEAFLAGEGKAAGLDERDSYGYAALHLAVDRGNLAAAQVLLTAGADKSLQDEDGNTPLDLARLAEHEDLVALLSSYSA